jgi:hypothetical protein
MTANINIRRSEAKDTAAIGDLIVDIQRRASGFSITLDDQPASFPRTSVDDCFHQLDL